MSRKGLLDTLLASLFTPPRPTRTVSRSPLRTPQRPHHPRPRHRSRWHRPGTSRYHWHLTPERTKYFFTRQHARWVCPFCGCG